MSFAFKVPKGGDSYDAKAKARTISRIEKVYDISVVLFPACPQASVEARTAIDSGAHSARLKKQAIVTANKILLKEV